MKNEFRQDTPINTNFTPFFYIYLECGHLPINMTFSPLSQN